MRVGQILRAKACHPLAGRYSVVTDCSGSGAIQYWLKPDPRTAVRYENISVRHVDTWFDLISDEERDRLFPDFQMPKSAEEAMDDGSFIDDEWEPGRYRWEVVNDYSIVVEDDG